MKIRLPFVRRWRLEQANDRIAELKSERDQARLTVAQLRADLTEEANARAIMSNNLRGTAEDLRQTIGDVRVLLVAAGKILPADEATPVKPRSVGDNDRAAAKLERDRLRGATDSRSRIGP